MKAFDGIDWQPTSTPRKRVPDAELGFGKVFSDHMLLWEYEAASGWGAPRIVPYGALPLDPSASVLHYGQAMFEGMKAFRQADGQVRLFRPTDHAKRMVGGAPRLCMPIPDAERLEHAIRTLVAVDQDWVPNAPQTSLYLRPTLIATEPALGVKASGRYLLYTIASPVGAYYATGWKPLRIWVEEKRVRAAPGGLGAVKSSANYVASLAASEEAKRRGFSQVLWLDAVHHRNIEEVGTMNLFVRIGDEVITPPLQGTILAGITRASALQLLRDWGLRASERTITIDEVVEAHRAGTLREVFGTGTAAVVSPVGELFYRDQPMVVGDGGVGEISQRLYSALQDLQYGRAQDTHGWLKAVGPAPEAAPAAARRVAGAR